jgi:protein TonB
MSLNNYILLSIFFHLMLFSLMTVIHPDQKSTLPVFNVKLIEPLDIKYPEAVTKQVQPVKKKIPPKRYPKPEVIRKTQKPPETMLGDDTESPGPKTKTQRNTDSNSSRAQQSTDEMPSTSKNGGIQSPTDKGPAPLAYLFDRETIEKFARSAPDGDKKGLSFDAPEFRHRGYMRMLKQRIESIWTYPEKAVKQGLSGDLYIRFSIKRDGSLERVELIRTSGYRSLDEAAMKAIKDAQPFWPLPDDWQRDTLVINGHFIYVLGSTVIM